MLKSAAKSLHRPSGIVYRNGRPSAVIIPIAEYREMLDRLEDAEDMKALRRMRNLKFRKWDEYLKDRSRV